MSKVDLKELQADAQKMPTWQKHKFSIMILGAITISLFLVMISMNLYTSDGTAQLDLSRPGYENVRAQAVQEDDLSAFSASGEIDSKTISDFKKLYKDSADYVIGADAFRTEALSDQSLNLPSIKR